MSLKPQLILQPIHNSTADILNCFAFGTPLSADQLNYIDWHHQQLSSREFDPVYKYYIESLKHKHQESASFMLSYDILNPDAIEEFKKRLRQYLQAESSRVYVTLTQEQFLKFIETAKNELMFWHGNKLFTRKAFVPGGIPPVIFFTWGVLFGVFHYAFSAHIKKFHPRAFILFEHVRDRNLDQCVLDYQNSLKQELEHQQNVLCENKIEPQLFEHFIIKPPVLTLNPDLSTLPR